MNILIAILLLFILLGIGVLISISLKYPQRFYKSSSVWSDATQSRIAHHKDTGEDLQKFARAMLTKLEEERRVKQEQELAEYARSKLKQSPLLPSSTNESMSGMTRVRSKSNELVPYNMSESERRLWEEFNS